MLVVVLILLLAQLLILCLALVLLRLSLHQQAVLLLALQQKHVRGLGRGGATGDALGLCGGEVASMAFARGAADADALGRGAGPGRVGQRRERALARRGRAAGGSDVHVRGAGCWRDLHGVCWALGRSCWWSVGYWLVTYRRRVVRVGGGL